MLNNHIPLDPILGGAIVMTKSTPLVNVVRGDLVPYTITATNTLNAVLGNVSVVDLIPRASVTAPARPRSTARRWSPPSAAAA